MDTPPPRGLEREGFAVMLSGYYAIASGMLMQQRTLDVLTNNLVNARTPGFRASRVVSTTFDQELLTRYEKYNTGVVGVGSPIRVTAEVPTKFDTSSLTETERPYDMALIGQGFFNIQADDGQGNLTQYLTRNGAFDVDEEGYLILPDIGRVLGEDGPIQLEDANFTVQEDGTIYDGDGRAVDTLLVTVPQDMAQLTANENGTYTVPDMALNQPADVTVRNKVLENSNVDFNQEYTMTIEAQRAFQACSSALQIIDKINQKSATQIAAL